MTPRSGPPVRVGRTGRSEARLGRPYWQVRGPSRRVSQAARPSASAGVTDRRPRTRGTAHRAACRTALKARGGQAGPPPGRATGHRADPAGQQAASTGHGPQVRPAAPAAGGPPQVQRDRQGRARLRRKQPTTQHVSRRLAYPLALLPGVQQELRHSRARLVGAAQGRHGRRDRGLHPSRLGGGTPRDAGSRRTRLTATPPGPRGAATQELTANL